MKKQLQYNYDEKYDVLYISVVPNEPAIGREKNEGIIIRTSRATGEFVGITIFDFKARLINNDLPGVFDYIDNQFINSIQIN